MEEIEYWVLCPDQGYEGLASPLGIFTSEEDAHEWAYQRHLDEMGRWKMFIVNPAALPTKEQFMSGFYLEYWLEKVKLWKK